MHVIVEYIFHSCFVAESDDAVVVMDYWRDRSDGRLHRLLEETDKQVYFVASHFHPDHYNPHILQYTLTGADAGSEEPCFRLRHKPAYLLGYDVAKHRHVPPALPAATLRPGHAYEDDRLLLQAYRSTDTGISASLRLKADPQGETLFHCGDLNNWYFSQEDEEPGRLKVSLRQMEGLYLAVVRGLAQAYPHGMRHLCFPIDPRLGPDMLRGATQWLRSIPVDHFYPMHYWDQHAQMAEGLRQLEEMFPRTVFHLPPDLPEAHTALSSFITSL